MSYIPLYSHTTRVTQIGKAHLQKYNTALLSEQTEEPTVFSHNCNHSRQTEKHLLSLS